MKERNKYKEERRKVKKKECRKDKKEQRTECKEVMKGRRGCRGKEEIKKGRERLNEN